jgi:hypothetical protein
MNGINLLTEYAHADAPMKSAGARNIGLMYAGYMTHTVCEFCA